MSRIMNDKECMFCDCLDGGSSLLFSNNYILAFILYIITSQASLHLSSRLRKLKVL